VINELYSLGQLAVAGIARGSVYALLAVSFSIVADTVGVWNFASAGVYAIVAYLVWYLVTNGLALPVGVALAFIVAAILMVGVDVTVHDPLRRRGATSEIIMVGSITVATLVGGILGLMFGSQSHGYPGNILDTLYPVGQLVITSWDITALLSMIVVLAVLGWVLFRTQFGRSIRAYGDNPELSVVAGSSRNQAHYGAYVVASVALVPAAILVGIHAGVDPGMGLEALLLASAAAILGGLSNVWAAASGGFLLGLATELPLLWLSPAWQSPIAFGILLLVVLVRPQGIFGTRVMLRRR
jgi:branched-subunit amino acid ABC-type transport system permease component